LNNCLYLGGLGPTLPVWRWRQ